MSEQPTGKVSSAETAQKLRTTEEYLALALQVSRMGIWEWDPVTGKLNWSAELKAIYGLPADYDITYESYLEKIHPDERELVETAIAKATTTGRPYTVEHRVVWPDGSEHWIQGYGRVFKKNGQVVRMLGTGMNIDRPKKFEIKLGESEQRFRQMADVAPVFIWVVDREGMATYLNKPWLDFTGRSMKQSLGHSWKEVIHPDDAAYYTQVTTMALDNQEPFRMEYRLRRYDGKYFWMLNKGVPRFSPEGNFLGFVGSVVEVEEIKSTRKRQRELEEVNRKLKQQSEQLIELSNSKDEFISLASHQLRTPATGVKQYIGMLLEGFGGELTDEQIKMLHTAYESNERQLRIIDDLLKVAHIDAGKVTLVREKTDLVKLTRAVIDEQADNFKRRGQHISLNTKHRQITAQVDAERIRMVLENLIDNASKYTPEGKNIEVTLTRTTAKVVITVKDQGVGIAKKDLPRLFRKFSRVDNMLSTLVGGTGLGLYWVKKIVSLHDGSVTVDSAPNRGSTFTVTLPRKEKPAR